MRETGLESTAYSTKSILYPAVLSPFLSCLMSVSKSTSSGKRIPQYPEDHRKDFSARSMNRSSINTLPSVYKTICLREGFCWESFPFFNSSACIGAYIPSVFRGKYRTATVSVSYSARHFQSVWSFPPFLFFLAWTSSRQTKIRQTLLF